MFINRSAMSLLERSSRIDFQSSVIKGILIRQKRVKNLPTSRLVASRTATFNKKRAAGQSIPLECDAFPSSVKWRFDKKRCRTVRLHARKVEYNSASLHSSSSEISIPSAMINNRTVPRQSSSISEIVGHGLETIHSVHDIDHSADSSLELHHSKVPPETDAILTHRLSLSVHPKNFLVSHVTIIRRQQKLNRKLSLKRSSNPTYSNAFISSLGWKND